MAGEKQNVMLVKLANGESFVAEVEEAKAKISVKNAMRFELTQQGIGVMPWVLFAKQEQEFDLSRDHVMAVLEVDDEIKQGYLQQFSSIILPQQNKPVLKLTE